MISTKACLGFLLGSAVGIFAGSFCIVPDARALSCVDKDSVSLVFESASAAGDEEFWRREFSPPEGPSSYYSRTLTNNSLRSHDGWWRLDYVGDN